MIYYTKIKFETIAKNSWKLGGNAITTISDDKSGLKMEYNQYGKTKEEAERKMMKFLTSNGTREVECIE